MFLTKDEYVYLANLRKGPLILNDLDPIGRKLKNLKLISCQYLDDVKNNPTVFAESMISGRLITPRRLSINDAGKDALQEYEDVLRKEAIARRWNIAIVVIGLLTLIATTVGIFATLGWLS